MSSITERFERMPRAARWIVFGGAAIVGYFFVIEPVLDLTNNLNARADRLALALAEEESLLGSTSAKALALRQGTEHFGKPLLPTDKANRPEALQRLVNDTLRKYGTRGERSERNQALRSPLLDSIVGPANKLERYTLTVTFESSPEDAARILADLEQSPAVATVSRIEIRHADSRRGEEDGPAKVKVTVSPEAWVMVGPAGRKGGAE